MSPQAGRFVLTPRAELDLGEIWDYIAQDSLEQANRVLNDLEKAILALADNPNMGFLREDWADRRHRFWPVYSYIIFYRPEAKPLQVLRVISGYRNLAELLKNPL
jgi:plasmid stabilization system protein ParE